MWERLCGHGQAWWSWRGAADSLVGPFHVALCHGWAWIEVPCNALAVKFGHPLRKPLWMALSRVDIRGLHRDWWANFMLLALVRTVWMNKLTWFDGGFFFVTLSLFPHSCKHGR